jgi:hypothetical protein
MRRQATMAFAALVVGSAALAQDGDLAGVTMRVLDDLRDVDAVVLELDGSRSAAAEGAAGEDGEDGADAEQRGRDAASRDEAAAEDARRAERRDRDALHDVDADERSEGRLEDRDVERSTAPPAPASP